MSPSDPTAKQTAVRAALALFASVVLTLLLGACAGSGEQGVSAGALKPIDVNALPRERVKDGGTLRWPVEQLATQWNYNHLNGPNSATSAVIGALMPGSGISDERGEVTMDRDYVLSAEITSPAPKQVVTYRLNPKATWSDGKPIIWRDYEAQWKALRSAEGRFQIASSTGYERVEKVEEGRDPHEVVVTFSKPYGEWRGLFSPLYPSAVNEDPKEFNEGYVNRIPVTAGPFRLKEIDQTAKTVTVERDPKWWGPPSKLDRIVFRALAPEAAINAFVSSEVDLTDVGPNPSAYQRVRKVSGGAVRQAAGPDFRHFTLNGTSPVLSDVNVRRAVAMAINRNALTRADLTGLDWPPRTMDNHFFVNTQAGYRANGGEVTRFDPARARALLDRAGWRQAGPVRERAGKPLELRFVIPTGVPTSRQEAELTQAMLRDVGVRVDIRAVPEGDFFDKYVTAGNFDIAAFSWVGTPFPISSAKSIYAEPTKGPGGELVTQQNYARVGSPQLDDLMERAQGDLDQARARELINQADRLVWEEVHSLVLYQRPQITAVRSNLANYGSFGFKTLRYPDVGFAR